MHSIVILQRCLDYFGDDHSAYRTDLDLDLYGTGFGINVFWARPFSAPLENSETLSGSLYYGNSYAENETYAMDYKIGWAYYGYPDEPRGGTARGQAADMQEIYDTFS